MAGVVLLTGENGFLGRRVRARLEAEPTVAVELLPVRLGELGADHRFAVDTVIHLAASVRKNARPADLEQIVEANVVGLRLLLAALEQPPRRLLFASTTDVYGELGERVGEESSLQPQTEYAASKLLGERMAIGDARRRGYECVVLRFGHIYGPGEQAYEKFVPSTIRAMMKGRPPTVFGDGQTRRDLLYVDDAAEAVCRLALSPRELPPVLNVASSNTHSLQEIAETLIDIFGHLGRVRYLRDRPNPLSLGFDTRLLRENIGELEELALREGLSREVEHAIAMERAFQPIEPRAAGRV